jgi:cytochrome c5
MSTNSKSFKDWLLYIEFIGLILLIVLWVIKIPEAKLDNIDSTLIDRIKPLGQVYVEADTNTALNNESVAISSNARSGEEIYTSSCSGCHSSGVLGAPKSGHNDDWSARLEGGVLALLKSSISGKGAMPARGTCTNCSDDELMKAIEFMIK